MLATVRHGPTLVAPPPLQAHYRDWGRMQFARSVLVLHNMVGFRGCGVARGRCRLTELLLCTLPLIHKLDAASVRALGTVSVRALGDCVKPNCGLNGLSMQRTPLLPQTLGGPTRRGCCR